MTGRREGELPSSSMRGSTVTEGHAYVVNLAEGHLHHDARRVPDGFLLPWLHLLINCQDIRGYIMYMIVGQ